MKLIEPNISYLVSFRLYMNEYKELNDEMYLYIYAESFGNFKSYIKLLQNHSEGRRLPKGWSAYKTYWLVDYNEVVGVIRIRYNADDLIGNIGYDIRPSFRGEGYGNSILELGLIKSEEELNMKVFWVSCKAENLASRKIIEKNKGKFQKIVKNKHGDEFYMYKITL